MENTYYPEGVFTRSEDDGHTFSLSGLESAMESGRILEGKVVLCDTYHNLHVELGGYRGIIPRQEVVYCPSDEPVKDIAVITRVGKKVCFKVTDIEKQDGKVKITLSRRLAQKECHENYINGLSCGDVIYASVTHMEKFGVFCDIGCGLTALLPIDCISVSRINHPDERFYTGQIIKCVIRYIEKDICRVTLTHKELLGTWQENAEAFSAGETVTGIVRSVRPYGIFVELSPNLAGLAEWCGDVVEGQTAAVYIKSIIPEKMKIKLVIVDVSEEEVQSREINYHFDDDHMDCWKYSPDGCVKEIYTEF